MTEASEVGANQEVFSIGSVLNRLGSALSSAGSVLPGVGTVMQLGETARGLFSSIANSRTGGDGYSPSSDMRSDPATETTHQTGANGNGIIDTMLGNLSSIWNTVSSSASSALSTLANGGTLALFGQGSTDPNNSTNYLLNGLDENNNTETQAQEERARLEREENEATQLAHRQQVQVEEETRLRTRAEETHDEQERQRLLYEANGLQRLTAQNRQLQATRLQQAQARRRQAMLHNNQEEIDVANAEIDRLLGRSQ